MQPDPVVDEVLAQWQQDVAERLATLSIARESPVGVSAVEKFTAGQVEFGTSSWRERLLCVEGWLNLGVPLSSSSPEAFVNSLSEALGVAPSPTGGAPTPELL